MITDMELTGRLPLSVLTKGEDLKVSFMRCRHHYFGIYIQIFTSSTKSTLEELIFAEVHNVACTETGFRIWMTIPRLGGIQKATLYEVTV